MSKVTPYEFCLECPKRNACCRLTDEQNCSAMTQKLEHLERDFADGKYSVAAYAALLVELLPGIEHGFYPSIQPERPTQAACGSDEKILLMRARVEAGFSPFHPDDTKRQVCRRTVDDGDE